MSRLTERRTVRTLCQCAILIALGILLHVAENSIPFFTSAMGGKLGLANLVTLYACLTMGLPAALTVGLGRVVVAGLLSGAPTAILYGGAGTLISVLAMVGLGRLAGRHISAVGLSVAGAACYNVGQILVARLLLGSGAVFAYLPVLTLIGAFAGLATGTLIHRIKLPDRR